MHHRHETGVSSRKWDGIGTCPDGMRFVDEKQNM